VVAGAPPPAAAELAAGGGYLRRPIHSQPPPQPRMIRRLVPLLCLAALPAAAQDVGIPHTTFELDNGLRVIVAEDHSTPVAAVNLWYGVGSAFERPGRTGFAHLFEHVMFEGSRHVARGEFDNLLEAAGAWTNASVTTDRTNYFAVGPATMVELAFWLEADRMGALLETMTQEKLDGQREVVKNERRQRYENQPYGMLWEIAYRELYPEGHPYSWTPIGSMEDLAAASLEDVAHFFRTYYAPNNATLAVVGAVDPAQVRALAERYFGWIPRAPEVTRPSVPVPAIPETRYLTQEDRVTLPEVTMIWRTGPRFSGDDAALTALARILTGDKNARLFRRLVYDEQIAQSTSAWNSAMLLSGDFWVRIRARQDVPLERIRAAVDEEIARLAAEPPTEDELRRVVNSIETGFVSSLETAIGRADQLNSYLYYTGDPGYTAADLARYRALTPADVQRAARDHLHGRNRVVLSFVPQGKTELAVTEVR
jgi:zinc protease